MRAAADGVTTMRAMSLRVAMGACAALAAGLFVVPRSEAGCSDRPGTPDNLNVTFLRGEPRTTLRLTFRAHQTCTYIPVDDCERQWWDVDVREDRPDGPVSGRGLTGAGPPADTARHTGQFVFAGLKGNKNFCFRVRARSEPGTQGCVSERWSGWACKQTEMAAAPPPPPPPTTPHWAAVAADGRGRWGFAVGMQSEAEARAGALAGCGSAACKIERVARAACIAYAESRSGGYWYGLSVDHTKWLVQSVAQDGCSKGAPAGTCKLIDARCR